MGCGASGYRSFIRVEDLPSSRSTWSYQTYPIRHANRGTRGLTEGLEVARYNRNFPHGEVNINGLQPRLRRLVQEATRGSKLEQLEEVVELYKKHVTYPGEEYYRAIRQLEYLKLHRGLRDALRRRHAGVLDTAIQNARTSPHAKRLLHQIEVAERLRDHLLEIKSVKHDVRTSIDLKTVSEIRGYNSPPHCVFKVMAAACMLMGYSERMATSWADVQTVLGRTGRDNPLQLMHEFDPRLVPPNIAGKVDQILTRHKLDEVRQASHGAAGFHIWASTKLDQVYSVNGWKRRRK